MRIMSMMKLMHTSKKMMFFFFAKPRNYDNAENYTYDERYKIISTSGKYEHYKKWKGST